MQAVSHTAIGVATTVETISRSSFPLAFVPWRAHLGSVFGVVMNVFSKIFATGGGERYLAIEIACV